MRVFAAGVSCPFLLPRKEKWVLRVCQVPMGFVRQWMLARVDTRGCAEAREVIWGVWGARERKVVKFWRWVRAWGVLRGEGKRGRVEV